PRVGLRNCQVESRQRESQSHSVAGDAISPELPIDAGEEPHAQQRESNAYQNGDFESALLKDPGARHGGDCGAGELPGKKLPCLYSGKRPALRYERKDGAEKCGYDPQNCNQEVSDAIQVLTSHTAEKRLCS